MISHTGTLEPTGTEDRIDAILDRALEATFPVSDPVAFPLGGGAFVQDNRYPVGLISSWSAPDGTYVSIRPVRPDDVQLMQEFVKALSPKTKYLRFMSGVRELPPAMIARLTRIEYGRDMALLALVSDRDVERQVGVVRYVRAPDGESAEMATVVADDWQGRGLSRHLLTQLIDIARASGLKTLSADILTVNKPMLALSRALGFELDDPLGDGAVARATLRLSGSHHAALLEP
jgi:acetyltransferase